MDTTTASTADLMGLHETLGHAVDADKAAELANSMSETGWHGAPLLVCQGACLNGTHRLVAARDAGLTEIPVLDLADMATDEQITQAVAANEWAEPVVVMAALAAELLGDQAEAYGADLDTAGIQVEL